MAHVNGCRLGFGLLLGLLLAGSGASWADEGPRVEVSIKPIHALVARLMEGIGEPGLIVERTPYGHTLSAAQRARIDQADLVVWVGPELEPFLTEPVAARPPSRRSLTLLDSEVLKVLPARADDSRRDPFLWLDTRNALILIDLLAEELVAIDPPRATRYRRNQAAATAELDAIDREFEYRYRDVSVVPIVLYHDTQQYFEQAYAASVAAIVAGDPRAEPSAQRLLEARGRLGRARCVFTEAGLPAPLLQTLTGGTDVQVAELDSFGTTIAAGPEAYVRLMRRNFDTLHRCIVPGGQPARPAGHFSENEPATQPGRLSGRFVLVNHHGQTVTDADFAGRFRLFSFGYTACPDVCPTTLAVLAAALRQLGDERAARVQPMFVSVDPERDTTEVLSQYVKFFHPQIMGLTGPKAMVDTAVHDFGVRYEYVPDGSGGYTVNHTAGYFLFGPDGRFLTKIAHGATGAELAERLAEYLR